MNAMQRNRVRPKNKVNFKLASSLKIVSKKNKTFKL